MNTFETIFCTFLIIWSITAIVNIPLTIWSTKLKAKKQSENNACIFALYKELEKYNNSNCGNN